MKKNTLLLTGVGIAVILLVTAGYSMQSGRRTKMVETAAEIEEPETAEKEAGATPVPTSVPSPTPMPTEEPAETEEEDFYQSLREEGTDESEETAQIEVTAMDSQMYAVQNVNLRSENAVTSEALRTISFGEQVHVTGITVDKQWYQVEDTEKGTGYVASSYLSDTKPAENKSEVQRQSNTNDGSLAPAQDASGEQSTSNGSGVNGTGLSQEEFDLLKQLAGPQTGYDASQETGSHEITGGWGEINQ